jgi:hypothetical protein
VRTELLGAFTAESLGMLEKALAAYDFSAALESLAAARAQKRE